MYYVYVHRDNQGNTFYVGKGRDSRAKQFRDCNRDCHEQVSENKEKYNVEIIAENLDENTALLLERSIVKALSPNLTNVRTYEAEPVDFSSKLVKQVQKNSRNVDELLKEVRKIKKKLSKLKLTEEENQFFTSGKATCSDKQPNETEIMIRHSVASKLSKRKKLEDKLKTIQL